LSSFLVLTEWIDGDIGKKLMLSNEGAEFFISLGTSIAVETWQTWVFDAPGLKNYSCSSI
jgi:hypothetical protein